MATCFGQIDNVRLLLEKGADKTVCDEDGGIPLHMAARNGHLEAVELLLVDDIDAVEKGGVTPLMTAVISKSLCKEKTSNGHAKVVGFLLEKGADPNGEIEGYKGEPPLHVASRNGDVEMVKLLIEHGATVDRSSNDELTPLHVAATLGKKEVVEILLQGGAKVNEENRDGITALDLASCHGNAEVVALLEGYVSASEGSKQPNS